MSTEQEDVITHNFKPEYVIDSFETLPTLFPGNHSENLLRGILAHGFEAPSTIQRQSIVPLASGVDCLIQAQSGRGKTASFVIGSALRVDPSIGKPQVIILEPVRELATQTFDVASSLLQFMGINIALHIGGVRKKEYKRSNPNCREFSEQVIIATPGRMLDLMSGRADMRPLIDKNSINTVVLDEADELLSMGFKDNIRDIVKQLDASLQVALFSATIPNDVLELTKCFMREASCQILIPEEKLTLDGIKQFYVDAQEEAYKEGALVEILQKLQIQQCVIFVNKKYTLDRLYDVLTEQSIKAVYIHGKMSHIEREESMLSFRAGEKVMVSTDLTARGIDVHQTSLVINYDIPDYETYIHRVGRTGRYGKKGVAITLTTDSSKTQLNDIIKRYNVAIDPLPGAMLGM